MERRLAAIMAADVVGYSRLIRADEEGTIAALKALRSDFIDPKIAEHHGRIVKLMGDGMLAEFASVVDAVRAAVEMQCAVAEHNAGLPPDNRIEFRIGVNLGDVVIDGDDIHGDGVNVAARLEGLAEPGGICFSGMVYEGVRDRIDVPFEDMGEQEVKNIDRPVRVWRWVADTPRSVVGLAAKEEALSLPDKPSIAVLPFDNMSGDPEQEYFSDGITEDIITELSRFRSLFVIARNSSFLFKGEAVDVSEVGHKLGVQYVVEGSVRKAGSRVRITAQLVDAESGNHLWAERYDRDLEDIFAVQDEVTRTVVSTVVGRIDAVGHQRASRMSPDGLKAYDLVLRAKALSYRLSKAGNAEARKLLERAIALDPANAQAHAMLSFAHLVAWLVRWVKDRDTSFCEALRYAKKAVALDDADSRSHWILGEVYLLGREYDKARFHVEKAVELNPNDVESRGVYGMYLTYVGEADEAIAEFDRARQVDPHDLRWMPWLRGLAFFSARRYDEAIACLEQIEDPHNRVRAVLAASYAYAGRVDRAKATLETFLRVGEDEMVDFPGRSLGALRQYWGSTFSYKNEADVEHVFDGLKKAGMED